MRALRQVVGLRFLPIPAPILPGPGNTWTQDRHVTCANVAWRPSATIPLESAGCRSGFPGSQSPQVAAVALSSGACVTLASSAHGA